MHTHTYTNTYRATELNDYIGAVVSLPTTITHAQTPLLLSPTSFSSLKMKLHPNHTNSQGLHNSLFDRRVAKFNFVNIKITI